MSVTVKLPPGPQGRRDKLYETADDFDVDDGHLLITAGSGRDERPVAVYAPGQWQVAEVVEAD